MIASHDSLTGCKLKSWWFKPLEFISKCQNKDIESQLNAGVRYFDLRFNKYKGKWYGSHGPMLYDITIDNVFDKLRTFTLKNKENVYFRILMEDTFDKDTTLDLFKEYVLDKYNWYKTEYMNLHLIGEKSNWNNHIYYMNIPFYGKNDYEYTKKDIQDKIDEIADIKERNDLSVYECYTYKGIPWLFGLPIPRLISKKINKYVKPSKNFTMIDFV